MIDIKLDQRLASYYNWRNAESKMKFVRGEIFEREAYIV